MECQKCGREAESLIPVNGEDFAVYQDAKLTKLITYKWARQICSHCVRGAIQDPEYARTDLYGRKYEASKELERGEITPEQYTQTVRGIDYQLSQIQG